jgi:hypothetical protein
MPWWFIIALVLTAGIVLAIGLVITSARATEGRFSASSTGSLRFQTLSAGLTHLGSPATRTLLADDLGYRAGGNTFGALGLQALSTGEKPLGLAPLRNDVLLAVPSFINPNKDSSDVGVRVEKTWAEEHLALTQLEQSPGVYLDILPIQLGGTMGFWGPWGLLLVAGLLGFAFARADRWILKGVGPARAIIGLGLVYCVAYYEGSWDVYTVTARGVVLLLVVMAVIRLPRYLVRAGPVRVKPKPLPTLSQ